MKGIRSFGQWRRGLRRIRALDREWPGLGTLVRKVGRERLTYLEPDALCDLAESVRDVEHKAMSGMVVECGCGLGGSAIILAGAKAPHRELRVFDAFAMIPPPSEKDGTDAHHRYDEIVGGESAGIGGDSYYGYESNLHQKVENSFRRLGFPLVEHNVRLIRGLFEDTLQLDAPVALAHIDADWYESVFTCLQRIEPNMVSGARLVIDDYDTWSGCRSAVDDFLGSRRGSFYVEQKARLHIVKA